MKTCSTPAYCRWYASHMLRSGGLRLSSTMPTRAGRAWRPATAHQHSLTTPSAGSRPLKTSALQGSVGGAPWKADTAQRTPEPKRATPEGQSQPWPSVAQRDHSMPSSTRRCEVAPGSRLHSQALRMFGAGSRPKEATEQEAPLGMSASTHAMPKPKRTRPAFAMAAPSVAQDLHLAVPAAPDAPVRCRSAPATCAPRPRATTRRARPAAPRPRPGTWCGGLWRAAIATPRSVQLRCSRANAA
mmetsp:Transcript_13908/g.41728  ORF Transcript_13908/g.41728 Transcript_13908/m.41728 type:complete len:243 (-) Transcript_13908:8-736(-)